MLKIVYWDEAFHCCCIYNGHTGQTGVQYRLLHNPLDPTSTYLDSKSMCMYIPEIVEVKIVGVTIHEKLSFLPIEEVCLY